MATPRSLVGVVLHSATSAPTGDDAEADERGHAELRVLESTGSKQAIGASQVLLYVGTYVRRRLASTVELSAQGGYPFKSGSLGCAAGRQGLPGLVRRAAGVVPGQGCLPRLSRVVALAGRVPMPAMRWANWVAVEHRSLGVHGVRASDVGHGGDDLPPHADPTAAVVRGSVGDDKPEARRLRAGDPAVAGARLLPDGVGDAAPLPDGDGTSRP